MTIQGNNREETAKRLLRQVAKRPVSDDEWRWLVEEYRIFQVLVPLPCPDLDDSRQKAERNAWTAELKDAWAACQSTKVTKQSRPVEACQEVHGWLREDERVRAIALSEWLAARAAHHPLVVRFRATYLGGHVLDAGWSQKAHRPSSDFWHDLDRVAAVLASVLPWTEEDARRFVTAGTMPPVSPLTATTEAVGYATDGAGEPWTSGTITLTAHAWLSEETVIRAYKDLRRDMIGSSAKPIGSRELAVFQFVLPHLDVHRNPPESWTALAHAWNKEQEHVRADWKYDTLTSLKRAFESVRERLLKTNYQWLYGRLGIRSWSSPVAGDMGTRSHVIASTREPARDVIHYRAALEDNPSPPTPAERNPLIEACIAECRDSLVNDGSSSDGNSDGNR